MNKRRYLVVTVVSLGAIALLGYGVWALFGPGSPAAAGPYGNKTYACDPYNQSVRTEPVAETEWGMMGGFGEQGETAPDSTSIQTSQTIAGSTGWWIPCAEPGSGPVTSLDAAVGVARGYVASSGNPNLVLSEVMQFADNYYAIAVEKNTGVGAFEFLIDPSTGTVYPEPGPNRMWNTKYSAMRSWGGMPGMMGGTLFETPTAAMPVGVDQARGDAQRFLNESMPGTVASDDADTFYGYYTFHVLQGQGGRILGMLSVNGTTGAVWYHTWHGPFVAMEDATASVASP